MDKKQEEALERLLDVSKKRNSLKEEDMKLAEEETRLRKTAGLVPTVPDLSEAAAPTPSSSKGAKTQKTVEAAVSQEQPPSENRETRKQVKRTVDLKQRMRLVEAACEFTKGLTSYDDVVAYARRPNASSGLIEEMEENRKGWSRGQKETALRNSFRHAADKMHRTGKLCKARNPKSTNKDRRKYVFWLPGMDSDGLKNEPVRLLKAEEMMRDLLRSEYPEEYSRSQIGEVLCENPEFPWHAKGITLSKLEDMDLVEFRSVPIENHKSEKMYRAKPVLVGDMIWSPTPEQVAKLEKKS